MCAADNPIDFKYKYNGIILTNVLPPTLLTNTWFLCSGKYVHDSYINVQYIDSYPNLLPTNFELQMDIQYWYIIVNALHNLLIN